jgi:hypothetical protein
MTPLFVLITPSNTQPHVRRLGEIGEDDLPPYEEPEGVTTIPLPPITPVLVAFLIWRAGKQGLKLLESWRVKQVRGILKHCPLRTLTS